MKSKFFRYCINLLIIVVAILTPLLSLYLAPSPVYAASISLNPPSATVDSKVQVIGEGFSGRIATIHFDDKIIATKVPILENGSLKYDLVVPRTYKGNHLIRITDDSNWSASTAEIDFLVKPSLTIFPTVTKEYSEITVIGNGFSGGEKDINVTVDGKVVTKNPITADRNGYWGTLLTISGITRGEHKIGASSSATSASEINTVDFIVTPFVKITPLSGPVGTQLLIYGWGFRGNEDGVSITWDNEIIKVNIRAELDGSLIVDGSKVPHSSTAYTGDTRETVFVPPTTQGKHIIGVYGSSFTPRGTFNDTIFEVVPHLDLKTAPDIKGTRAQVNGTGFGANELITLSINKTPTNNSVTTDNNGSFTMELVIPTIKGKEYIISSSGNKGNSSETSFVSTTGQSLPSEIILISPVDGYKIIIFDSVGQVLANSIKYLSGFIAYMKGSPVPSHTISNLRLAWTASSSPDIKYIIQVADDSTFKSLVLETEVTDRLDYLLKTGDNLSNGKYWWKVKAVSSSGNESPWSKPAVFEIAPMTTKVAVLTILIVTLIIAAIIVGILTAWVNFANR